MPAQLRQSKTNKNGNTEAAQADAQHDGNDNQTAVEYCTMMQIIMQKLARCAEANDRRGYRSQEAVHCKNNASWITLKPNRPPGNRLLDVSELTAEARAVPYRC